MNIKILDSWLREYLETKANPQEIAEKLSLTSVSVERVEPFGAASVKDFVYDIEITTNRPDLMSVVGLAREAATILPQFDIEAKFIEPKFQNVSNKARLELEIITDSKLVNRLCAIALDISVKESPEYIKKRLEATGINPHNNLIDVTNYVMREIGHPMHAFDYDKLKAFKKLIIREAKTGEKIVDLHGDEHTLKGGDIVADDGTGTIIDLLGIMGTFNSAVDDSTKRVLLFVDNDNQHKIRKTSMSLGLRSEAAVLNEKGVDPEKAYEAILRGVDLLEKIADGKVISEVFDAYPNKPTERIVSVTEEKIKSVIGIEIPFKTSSKILSDLGFEVTTGKNEIKTKVPSWRANDVEIPEDLVEEIARVYGYFRLPSILTQSIDVKPYSESCDQFYFELRVREALKYWSFTEIYTYPMVSEDLLEVATKDAVTIKNPLTLDRVYMRTTLIPSLLEAARENKNRQELKIFEISNVYHKKQKALPEEKLMFAAILKNPKADFFELKGIVEAVFSDLGIKVYEFRNAESGARGASIYIGKTYAGEIEQLEADIVDFELDFEVLRTNASLAKIYTPVSKFPESSEDLRFEIDPDLIGVDETIPYQKIVKTIKEQSSLIKDISLLDVYKNKKTFHIVYQSNERNLTNEDLTELREKITSALKKHFKAEPA